MSEEPTPNPEKVTILSRSYIEKAANKVSTKIDSFTGTFSLRAEVVTGFITRIPSIKKAAQFCDLSMECKSEDGQIFVWHIDIFRPIERLSEEEICVRASQNTLLPTQDFLSSDSDKVRVGIFDSALNIRFSSKDGAKRFEEEILDKRENYLYASSLRKDITPKPPYPKCVCGDHLALNADYTAQFTANGRVKDWIQKYVCIFCLSGFAYFAKETQQYIKLPNLGDFSDYEGIKTLRDFAEQLNDPLAIAHSNYLLGKFAMAQEFGLEALEKSYEFLKTYEHYKGEDFFEIMRTDYVLVMEFLAISLLLHNKAERALSIANERLQYDKKNLDSLNPYIQANEHLYAMVTYAKTLGLVGRVYGFMKDNKAEEFILQSIEMKKEAGLGLMDLFFSHLFLLEYYVNAEERKKSEVQFAIVEKCMEQGCYLPNIEEILSNMKKKLNNSQMAIKPFNISRL
nr:hypothetical protein [Candidatus Sigynarchaeota archaeon]